MEHIACLENLVIPSESPIDYLGGSSKLRYGTFPQPSKPDLDPKGGHHGTHRFLGKGFNPLGGTIAPLVDF